MPYRSPRSIERQRALSQSLANQPMGRGKGSGIAHILRNLGAYQGGRQAAASEEENQRIIQQERGQLAEILRNQAAGEPTANLGVGPLREGGLPSFQSPVGDIALQQSVNEATQAAKQRNKPTDYNKPFLPDGSPNPAYQEYQKDLRQLGRPQTTVNLGADKKYLSERAKSQSEAFGELEKQADTAVKSNKALTRFKNASPDSTEGGAQPVIDGVKNFLVSFGADFDSLKSLADMQSGIASIKASFMRELGARGLTDTDMRVLGQALPEISTSHEARTLVADIVMRNNEGVIGDYLKAVQQENELYPDYQFIRPRWLQDQQRLLEARQEMQKRGM